MATNHFGKGRWVSPKIVPLMIENRYLQFRARVLFANVNPRNFRALAAQALNAIRKSQLLQVVATLWIGVVRVEHCSRLMVGRVRAIAEPLRMPKRKKRAEELTNDEVLKRLFPKNVRKAPKEAVAALDQKRRKSENTKKKDTD
jgi:hypothetical protein